MDSGRVTIRGVFGVFMPGMDEAVFYGKLGEELRREVLQVVDRREVIRLDKSVTAPAEASRVSVRLVDADVENRGFIGNLILKYRRVRCLALGTVQRT